MTAIVAALILRRGAQGSVGGERIALMEAVAAHRSISGAAKSVGLSYKGAWDAVQALNNLADRPLIVTKAGGRLGGFAEVTREGLEVIAAFHALEAETAHVLARLEQRLAGVSSGRTKALLWSLGMKTSARNALRGVVDHVTDGAVNAEVVLNIGKDAQIVAVVTRQSVADLGLTAGANAIALIKSSSVILAPGKTAPRTSARNALSGIVVRIARGVVNDEIVLDIGAGKTLTATVTHESAEALDLKEGDAAIALIKASHIILAVE
jgi:molybdate transport system regulatory protein